MEEVYIVKLKGLPPPPLPSHPDHSKDSKTSFYYHTDLTAEAIRGFSYLHIFFGITVLCLSITNLCFHDNPLALEPPLGITVWCAISFMILGFFGILTAYKRKCDLSRSIYYVKFQLVLIIIVLSLTLTFAILFMLDLHGPIANQFIGLNMMFSIIVETVLLLLTLFTCCRILWPGCLNFCAKDWPMQPNLKRKMIIKTNIFTDGIQQDQASIIQSFGPNCVISLNMPPTMTSSNTATTGAGTNTDPSSSSSICSSPTANYQTSKHKSTTSLLGSFSDLAKSLPTIYAVPDNPTTVTEDSNAVRQQIATISTNSIYYNYPTLCGAISTTNLLQTFPTAAEQLQKNPINKLPLLQQQQPLQNLPYQNDSTTDSWYRGGNGSADSFSGSVSEEIDPYDTDEFDYCSTEDNEENDHDCGGGEEGEDSKAAQEECCQKSSSDDGNGTLEDEEEEESKSTTESETSSSQMLTNNKTGSDDDAETMFLNTANYVQVDNSLNHNHDHQNNPATYIEIKSVDPKLELNLSTIKKTIEDLNVSNKSLDAISENNDDDDDDDGPEDEGLGSTTSNSSDSSSNGDERPINRIELRSFSNDNNQPAQQISSQSSKTLYKSSIIKIESSPPPITNTNTSFENNENKSSHSTVKMAPSATSGTSMARIRLLNTNKIITKATPATIDHHMNTNVTTNHTKINRLQIDHHPSHATNNKHNSQVNCIPNSSVAKIGSKLASHPYLCRLRATNPDNNFDHRVPKALVPTTITTPTPTTATKQMGPVVGDVTTTKQTVGFLDQAHHRIPDIQRV